MAKYDTQLTSEEEQKFAEWKAKYAPNDSGADYDLRGAYKAGLTPDTTTGHWPDTFKKPNHPTFSVESQYAKDAPELAGHWEGEKYVPPNPYSAALSQLVEQSKGSIIPIASQAGMIQVTKTGAPADNPELLKVFSEAFPDQTFEMIDGGVRSKPKAVKPSDINYTSIPDGYSPQLASKGIQDLKASLETAATDEDRMQIAIKLNTMVQTQKAYNFGMYKQRAEAEYGVPDILQAISQIQRAEAASPFNPGTGMPSAQRMQLIQQLGIARTHAAARIDDFMKNDPTLAEAENLSKGTLSALNASIALENKQGIVDARNEKTTARNVAITTMDPNYINGIAMIRNGRIPSSDEERMVLAAQIYDGKLKVTDTERALATATDEGLRQFYVTAKDPKLKDASLKMITAREEATTGDPVQAKNNIELFKKVMSLNLSDSKNPYITPDIQNQWKKAQSEVIAETAASGKSKDEELGQRAFAIKRELLNSAVKAAFYSDVSKWGGLVQGDQVARDLIQKAAQAKQPLNMTRFVDAYINTNDGRSLADKSRALQGMIVSGISAMPRSNVLPIPSEDSTLLEAQRITAASVARTMNFNALADRPITGLATRLFQR